MRDPDVAARSSRHLGLRFLLAAGVLGIALAAFPAASQACDYHQANVQGQDYPANDHWGNGGTIHVSTQDTLNNLNSYIYRSLFVYGQQTGSDVEIGWTDRWNGSEPFPYPYAEWVDVGIQDPGAITDPNSDINTNQDRVFKVQNTGHVNKFRFYFGTETVPFNYSPAMSFQVGTLATNSEHKNTCDTMYAHFHDLEYFDSAGNWNTPWENLQVGPLCSSINDWKFYDPNGSTSEDYVDQDSGNFC